MPPAWTLEGVYLNQRRHGPEAELGLPEVVGFALGAGAMATALVGLEARLSGSEAARRVVRDGVRAELHRVAADRLPRPRAPEVPAEAPRPRAGEGSIPSQRQAPSAEVATGGDGNLESCRERQGES